MSCKLCNYHHLGLHERASCGSLLARVCCTISCLWRAAQCLFQELCNVPSRPRTPTLRDTHLRPASTARCRGRRLAASALSPLAAQMQPAPPPNAAALSRFHLQHRSGPLASRPAGIPGCRHSNSTLYAKVLMLRKGRELSRPVRGCDRVCFAVGLASRLAGNKCTSIFLMKHAAEEARCRLLQGSPWHRSCANQ